MYAIRKRKDEGSAWSDVIAVSNNPQNLTIFFNTMIHLGTDDITNSPQMVMHSDFDVFPQYRIDIVPNIVGRDADA